MHGTAFARIRPSFPDYRFTAPSAKYARSSLSHSTMKKGWISMPLRRRSSVLRALAASSALAAIAISPPARAKNFSPIPVATSVQESIARYPARRKVVLESGSSTVSVAYAEDRDQVSNLVTRGASRILLGLDVSDTSAAILHPKTRVFAPLGSSNPGGDIPGCRRDGDYDFAVIDYLRLAYTAERHPGALSEAATAKLVDTLLMPDGGERYRGFRLTGAFYCSAIRLEDTENHILMIEVSRFLVNQLRAKRNPGNPKYDNASNGNTEWMLRHLAGFLTHHFEEYNSKPYQKVTVRALEVLYAYSEDERVTLAAQMVLEHLAGFMSFQSRGLRRHVPFRRQPSFELDESKQGHLAWVGDSESARFALVAGNYTWLEPFNYVVPDTSALWNTAATEYRLDPFFLDLLIEQDHGSRWAMAHHDNLEAYASSPSFLLSAGGIFDHHLPALLDDMPSWLSSMLTKTDAQHGWARPTTLAPVRERSASFRDWIRFEGHADRRKRQNTCVAPGFACGTDVRVPEAIESQCSVTVGNWRFFDFTNPQCPFNYGFYTALYTRQCTTSDCKSRAGNHTYGFLEAREPDGLSFDAFRQKVLANTAALSVPSEGIIRYTTTTGRVIEFEINPKPGQASIARVDDELFARDFSRYPLWRGETVFATTRGRETFDSPHIGERVILDMSDPSAPHRFHVDLPELHRQPAVGGLGGRYFDDSGDVMPNVPIAWIELRTGNRVDRLRYGYTSGLEVDHGGKGGSAKRLDFQPGEYIDEVRVSLTDKGDRLSSFHLKTNRGRTLGGGTVKREVRFTAEPGWQIVAFHGQSGDEIDRLGVVTTPLVPKPHPVTTYSLETDAELNLDPALVAADPGCSIGRPSSSRESPVWLLGLAGTVGVLVGRRNKAKSAPRRS